MRPADRTSDMATEQAQPPEGSLGEASQLANVARARMHKALFLANVLIRERLREFAEIDAADTTRSKLSITQPLLILSRLRRALSH